MNKHFSVKALFCFTLHTFFPCFNIFEITNLFQFGGRTRSGSGAGAVNGSCGAVVVVVVLVVMEVVLVL